MGTTLCMQQPACATKGMWALAKAPELFNLYIDTLNAGGSYCYASTVVFIISSSLAKLCFPFCSHCQNTLWSEGWIKAFLRAEKEQALVEQVTLCSNSDLSQLLPAGQKEWKEVCEGLEAVELIGVKLERSHFFAPSRAHAMTVFYADVFQGSFMRWSIF